MRHGSAFTGIGGFDLAAKWLGWTNVFQVEIDKYCTELLAKNFPDTARYRDIKFFDGKRYKGNVDVFTAGFPCQPFSLAGKRKGTEDDRYLWGETIRVIREVEPRYFIGENVSGITSLAFDTICNDLEAEGYEVQSFVIPACAVGAWHRRDRAWFIGVSKDRRQYTEGNLQKGILDEVFANTDSSRLKEQRISQPEAEEFSTAERPGRWKTEPRMGRVVDGFPGRVDRLKGLGNAIVPQVAFEIFKIIEKHEQLSAATEDQAKAEQAGQRGL